jgi:hypothetical protein
MPKPAWMIADLAALLMLATTAPLPVVSPDVRTAIATEQLVTATWALGAVALATLAAAAVAAVASVRAYRLEAMPALVFSGVMPGSEKLRELQPFIIARILRPETRLTDDTPNPVIRLFQKGDVVDGRLDAGTSGSFEVRNIGRSAVVEADIVVRVIVKIFDRAGATDPGGASMYRDVAITGHVRIASIGPNESVLLPFGTTVGPCTVKVLGVTALTPAVTEAGQKRAKRRFTSSEIVVGATFG